jgi:predicted dehydrogenase
MYKALVIGCGNIGAQYDIQSDRIMTHGKAFAGRKACRLTFYDKDASLAKAAARRHGAGWISELREKEYKSFEMISICTPTHIHYDHLKGCLKAGTPVILCEKPISYSLDELRDLKGLYRKGNSRVLVNYMRRFQPSYIQLKKKLKPWGRADQLIIKYKRGIANNGSHALDLLEFIFEKKINLSGIRFEKPVYDAFAQDPTLGGHGIWNNMYLNLVGIPDTAYPVFEIEIYYKQGCVLITDSGNNLQMNEMKKGVWKEQYSQTHCLNHYMLPVIRKAEYLLAHATAGDNFLDALKLNETILNHIPQ